MDSVATETGKLLSGLAGGGGGEEEEDLDGEEDESGEPKAARKVGQATSPLIPVTSLRGYTRKVIRTAAGEKV